MADEEEKQEEAPADEEVAEEQTEETPEEPEEEAVEQPEEGEEPPEEAPEQVEEELPPLPEQPPKVKELDAICGELRLLADTCEQVLGIPAILHDKYQVQAQLRLYASELSHFPRALQLLNDYRRLFKPLEEQALAVEAALTRARQDPEALTSEETRIIVSTGSAKDTVMSAIWALEELLTFIRHSTPQLLSAISYEGEGFDQYATSLLADLRIQQISHVVHQELQKLNGLKADLVALNELETHARKIAGEQQEDAAA